MKRMSLFEFEDFRWFPGGIRECLTLYIAAMHRVLGTERLLAPLLARALKAAATDRVVDLCSGGGGPMLQTTARLAADHGLRPSVTLTDLYPNTDAAARINAAGDSAQVRYHTSPVDAGRVPDALQGVRTMVCSFHHMPPPVARRILQDAFEKRQAICVLEISDNSQPRWLWWTAIPAGVLMVLLLTPFIRPLRLRQVLLTYALPVLPLFIAWDGAVSNARTYTEEDLRELLAGLEAPDYQWEITRPRAPGAPATMITLVGLPRPPSGA
ncbi:class I SAM-dependent methyltransferase [Archangium lipolyticum]|uniref:class I SAM-dependent methyltransferase n=1 Tax=Archangium lipolyticum TaxID=2970465 RepID=UPI00214A69F3|nr:class I SAM-dependent methyltransferase [Archangium lipolyticum]